MRTPNYLMLFGTPIALLLGLLALPVIVFYILKIRLRRVPVSTNLFWKQIYDERPPRSIWQYLRHLISLMIQLLMLSLLALAIADPFLPWQLLQARRIVVVVDNSASMRADDVRPTRFDAAITSAASVIDSLRFRDEMAIIVAGPNPVVALGMSNHAPTLKRSLNAIRVTDNATELDSAIQLAQQIIGDHPHGQIIVFTDGCVASSPTAEGKVPETMPKLLVDDNGAQSAPRQDTEQNDLQKKMVPLEESPERQYRVFGSPANNVGITQFQSRRSYVDPLGYEILMSIFNASDQSVTGRLEVELNGNPVDVIPISLDPDETWNRSIEKTSLEGGRLTGKLVQVEFEAQGQAEKDAKRTLAQIELNQLETDDIAQSILPGREIQNVLIVSPGNLFLQKVFEANPLVRLEVRTDVPSEWPQDALIVLHRTMPAILPPGNVFVVDPVNDCDRWKIGEVLDHPIITTQNTQSSLMTHVRLDNVLMPEARKLDFVEPPNIFAGALNGEPIYAEVRRQQGKCLVLSVNLDEGDLAFRTAFPIMVSNALAWFAEQTGEIQNSICSGTVAEIQAPNSDLIGPVEIILRSPSAIESNVPLRRERVSEANALNNTDTQTMSVGPLNEAGIWTLNRRSTKETDQVISELAVNLTNSRETDLRPADQFLERANKQLSGPNWLTRPIWFLLAMVALCLATVEWFLHQRRILT